MQGYRPRTPVLTVIALTVAAAALPAVAQPTRVLLIGDSITEGVVSGPDADPYAVVLAGLLGPEYVVTNIGCSSTTVLDWTLTRARQMCGAVPNLFEGFAVPNLPTDVVTVMFGTNDSVGWFEPQPISPRTYARGLGELLFNLRNEGAELAMLMTPPVRPCNDDPVVRDRLEGYRDVVMTACDRVSGTTCGPDVFTLLDQDDFEGCDVHPNAQGHTAIATALADAILALD